MKVRNWKLLAWIAIFLACLCLGLLPGFSASREFGLTDKDDREIILGHITDEHITEYSGVEYERLVVALRMIKTLQPSLLLSTGDQTGHISGDGSGDGEPASFQKYNQAFNEVGGFSKHPGYGAGIPFRPVAGNHDGWGRYPYEVYMGPPRHSFVIGNYRFIGWSGHPNNEIPENWLEQEMSRSCEDGRPIILFYHYTPSFWGGGMTDRSWAKIDALAQKYPVIAYLCGHLHDAREHIAAPGYTVYAAKHVSGNGATFYALGGGSINDRSGSEGPDPSIIVQIVTHPRQYREGLDYTKTEAELTHVRAYVRVGSGAIRRAFYQLDGGTEVEMYPAGEQSSFYEAPLDARELSGLHTIEVTFLHSYGSWATARQEITAYFDHGVPRRAAPGCPQPTLTPTATETATLTPTLTLTATPELTPSLTPTSTPAPTVTLTLTPDALHLWLPIVQK